MDKKYAIFDMDGTLVDSMVYWSRLAAEFLEKCGVPKVPTDLRERLKPMTMTETAELFIREFDLPGTTGEITAQMNAIMDEHYRSDIPLKAGIPEYLQMLKSKGVRMCVASATAKPLVALCLDRLGILGYFDFLLSCEDVGSGKSRPDVYLAAAERFGAKPDQVAVYEDALHAAKTAKGAGFYLVGVYDESAAIQWEELAALSDETISF